MARIGAQLVQEKKNAVLAAGGEKNAVGGRDLLSVLGKCKPETFDDYSEVAILVRANMASDINDNERLSDDEVMGRTLSATCGWSID